MLRMCVTVCVVIIAATASMAKAEDCGAERFGQMVDQTGDKLRIANQQSEQALRRNFEKLAALRKWPQEEAVERGYDSLQDETTRTLDQQASELLIRLNLLSDTEAKPATCERLDELRRAADRLLEVTRAKRAHVNARLAVILNPKLKAKPAPAKTAASSTAAAQRPSAGPNNGQASKSAAPPAASANGQVAANWATSTTRAPPPSPETMANLPPVTQQARDTSFSAHEIRVAGRGLFGTLSAELASVINFAFDSYGRPNGYVLGSEGGAAFLAGLRYGKGRMISKQFDPRTIYWQGPSIGTDFGLAGSRVMMLIYNLDDPKQLYNRFVGVEGAAYFVGGVGITFHKMGRMVLAPIRTGIGLRLGANVGYLKITPRRAFNPF